MLAWQPSPANVEEAVFGADIERTGFKHLRHRRKGDIGKDDSGEDLDAHQPACGSAIWRAFAGRMASSSAN